MMVRPRHIFGLVTGVVLFAPANLVASAQIPPTRWILAYPGSLKGGLGTTYSVDDFVRLLAAVDSNGRPSAWLSTGVIFLHLYAASGRTFTTWIGGSPARGSDWEQYVDSLMAPTGILERLDSAVHVVEDVVSPLSTAYPVAIMIPYPEPTVDTLRFLGFLYSLRTDPGRTAAVGAYAREVRSRFAQAGFRHLRLDAYYWLSENVRPPDTAVVIGVASVIHRKRLRFFWVPYYFALGQDRWRHWGFDEAWLQPNYFFSLQVPQVRLDTAARRAIALGLGVEVEFNSKIYSDSAYYNRFDPYLTLLATSPFLQRRSIVVYEGQGALIHLSRSPLRRDRAIYARLVQALTLSDPTERR